jgi:hypothetical protein
MLSVTRLQGVFSALFFFTCVAVSNASYNNETVALDTRAFLPGTWTLEQSGFVMFLGTGP